MTEEFDQGMLSWEEFTKGKHIKPAFGLSITNVLCPNCGERLYRDDSVVLTTYPVKHRYECQKCKWKGIA